MVTVPAGATRLVAEIASDESPDSDLMILGPDVFDGSLAPCVSAFAGSNERCSINNPAPGDYRIEVDNFTGSMDQPDAITLYDAVVGPAVSGTTSLSATALVNPIPQAQPWDLRVFFNQPGMQAGERWYGAVALGNSSGAQALGLIPVDLHRTADDVIKTADRF
jgi:hypothetical protein